MSFTFYRIFFIYFFMLFWQQYLEHSCPFGLTGKTTHKAVKHSNDLDLIFTNTELPLWL